MSRRDAGPGAWRGAALTLAVAIAGCGTPAERAAEPIVEKNAEARGGLKAWRQVKALAMAGNLEAGMARDPLKQAEASLRTRTENKAEARRAALRGADAAAVAKQVQLPFVMELKRPRASRLEIRFQGRTAVQVFDGTRGWKVRPFLGRHEVEPYTDEELRLAAQQAELDGPLIDHAAKGNKVELVGTEKVEGRDAYKLQVTSASGAVRHVWVDAQSYLEVKVDGTRRLDGKPRQVWTAYRDYRPVDGLLIPHTLETTVEGIPGSEKIVVERVSLNAEVADARFSKPE
jgi:hypothetical protein